MKPDFFIAVEEAKKKDFSKMVAEFQDCDYEYTIFCQAGSENRIHIRAPDDWREKGYRIWQWIGPRAAKVEMALKGKDISEFIDIVQKDEMETKGDAKKFFRGLLILAGIAKKHNLKLQAYLWEGD